MTTDDPLSHNTEIILKNLEKSLSNSNATTMYCDRNQDPARALPLVDASASLIDKRCECAIIIAHSYSVQIAEEAIDLLARANVPVVIVSSSNVRALKWNVYYDNFNAGYLATQHLIEHGCRTFLYVATEEAFWVTERLEGVKVALKNARVPEKDLQFAFVNGADTACQGAGYAATLAALKERVPNGIIASNDEIAAGANRAMQELHLTPGEHALLVGFDDAPVARQLEITSMRPPLEEMGQAAARLAIRAVMGDPTLRQVCLSSHLIARMSSNGFFPTL